MPRTDHIIDSYDGVRRAIMATVVDLQGSGYRRPGARMLIEEDGSYVGAISGGCLERDVVRNAWRWVEEGPQTVVFDTRANAFHPLGQYGTGCEGIVQVLLRELPRSAESLDLVHEVQRAHRAHVGLVIAHVYDGPSSVGQAAVWRADGTHEADAAFPERALRACNVLASEARETEATIGVRMLDGDAAFEVLVEWVAPPTDLLILGSGADAVALAEVATPLGWRVRAASTDAVRLRRFDTETGALDSPSAVAALDIRPHTNVVLMTHSLTWDREALPLLLDSPARWVGLLGPKRRTARLMGELHEAGSLPTPEQLDRLDAPVGLDIGGEDPWEIALAILAQIIARANGRDGGDLADRKSSIHRPHQLREIEVER